MTWSTAIVPWDYGVTSHLEQLSSPDWTQDPLRLDTVRDHHLRSAAGNLEDDYIERLIKVSDRMAERTTWRSHLPKQYALVMDRFPCNQIVLPRPPLISVDSIEYVDGDGTTQELAGSPELFAYRAASGPEAPKSEIYPPVGEVWPSTRVQRDAVVVTFTAGYPIEDDVATVPEDILHGRLLVIAELYKQRSLSVHANNQNPAIVQARAIWMTYRAY